MENQGEEFPNHIKAFLHSFYNAKKAYTETEKIEALKNGWNLQNAVFYSEDLKTLEFYVLTKLGLL